MKIKKRDGKEQAFMPNKILTRIKKQSKDLKVDPSLIFQEAIPLIKDGMTTTELDELIAFKAADKITTHPDYSILGGRILLTRQAKLIGKELQPVDYTYDFFAATTFLVKYAKKVDNKPSELPSCMYKRVASELAKSKEEESLFLEELCAKRMNFATPIYTNIGIESRGGAISCFTKDTKVVTKYGLKQISNIQKGDLVLTHNNRYMPVNEVYTNKLGGRQVKKVKIYRTKEIKCTDNHNFLSHTSEDERLNLNPSFKPISYLRVGDYIKGANLSEKKDEINKEDRFIDLMDYEDYLKENWQEFKATKKTKIIEVIINEIDNKSIDVNFKFERADGVKQKGRAPSKINRYWKIDENFCKFLGIYYGDGHIQRSKSSGISGVGITCKNNSPNVTNFVVNYVKDAFGIDCKIYNQEHDGKSWKKIMIQSKVFGIIWKKMFGALFSNKKIPNFIYELPISHIKNLIAGFISADGIVTNKGQLRLQIANNELLDNINFLSRKCGYTTGVSVTKARNNSLEQYRIDFGVNMELMNLVTKDYEDGRLDKVYNQKNKIYIKEINGEIYYRINDIQNIHIEDDYVYDLNIEEDHSYAVEHVIVHNCNLTHMKEDSIEGIEETLTKIAYASKEGAGIGLLIDPIRSKESYVSSFSGKAGGIVRLADMVQSKMRFYKQGTRSGSCALYLSVWHRDILDFLSLTIPIGDEKLRARDLFTAVVINDLFMEKLLNGETWHLFCPNDIKMAGLKPLYDLWGEEFEAEYARAVEMGLGLEVNPKAIWDAILTSQVESGKPYTMFKDNANRRNMQSNIGVIKQSNLCIEIFQASKPNYTPQCTLGSINLSQHEGLDTIRKSVKTMVRALNRVLDINKWSDDWSKAAGLDQRALAIGVAGLADFFAKKKISFESEEAKEWNEKIFSTIYKSAVEESMKMADEEGRVYPAWEGSLYSKGETYIPDWSPTNGKTIRLLNSLFVGLMPTASSAILLGVFESFEPVTSNLFTRRVGQGEFVVINKYLVEELDELGLWGEQMKDDLIRNSGSVQKITRIPDDIRHRYKDVWEIPQKKLLDLAVIRNKYVDQSQSLNVYHSEAKYSKISSALAYAWKHGLKTGVYYTRTTDKRSNNVNLAVKSNEKNNTPEKPKDSPFDCYGCSA